MNGLASKTSGDEQVLLGRVLRFALEDGAKCSGGVRDAVRVSEITTEADKQFGERVFDVDFFRQLNSTFALWTRAVVSLEGHTARFLCIEAHRGNRQRVGLYETPRSSINITSSVPVEIDADGFGVLR